MIENKQLKYYENIINFLEDNYNHKLAELNAFSKWWKPIMKLTIKKQLDDIKDDIIYYNKLILEYKKKGLL